MVSLFAYLLLGTAFAVSLWTILDSVLGQLPRMRELLGIHPVQPLPELVPVRITARSLPARHPAAFPLREAA
jgi:hypothetical protein